MSIPRFLYVQWFLNHPWTPSSVQSLSCVQLFATPWIAACQASLSFTNSQSLLKLVFVDLVIPSNHLILCHPFSSRLQSFPAPESFPKSWLFASGGQSIGDSVSASALPVNIQGWVPLGLTGLISRQPKGLSRVFSSTTVGNYSKTKNLDKHSIEEKCSPARLPPR